MAGTFFGTQSTSLAEVQIEFVSPGGRRYLYGRVRAVHITVAAVETETAAETAFRFFDNIFQIKRWIDLPEIFQPRVNRHRLFIKLFLFSRSFR